MENNWYKQEYGFFGLFYHIGDNSIIGFDANRKMNRKQRTEREISYINKYLAPQANHIILDCPCGNGRHSIELARQGCKVIGVDLNESMFEFIKDLNTSNVLIKPDFIIMDMRKLDFKDNSFDFIINMFLSFGFFTSDNENEKVVQEFYRVLKPGGKVFIHLDFNYDNVITRKFNGMEHVFRECVYKNYRRILEIEEKYNSISKRLEGSWTLNNGMSETRKYSLRIYNNEKEFVPLFKSNGFKNATVLDPLTGMKANDKSVETVLIAEK